MWLISDHERMRVLVVCRDRVQVQVSVKSRTSELPDQEGSGPVVCEGLPACLCVGNLEPAMTELHWLWPNGSPFLWGYLVGHGVGSAGQEHGTGEGEEEED